MRIIHCNIFLLRARIDGSDAPVFEPLFSPSGVTFTVDEGAREGRDPNCSKDIVPIHVSVYAYRYGGGAGEGAGPPPRDSAIWDTGDWGGVGGGV